MSSAKSRRKQARKAAIRARQAHAKRLTRNALICAGVAGLIFAVMLALAFAGLSGTAARLVGPIGVALLVAVGFLARRERVSRYKFSFLSRIGLVLALVTGVELVTTQIIYVIGHDQAAQLVGMLAIVPAVFAVAALGSGWGRGPGRDDSTTTAMTDIVRFHT